MFAREALWKAHSTVLIPLVYMCTVSQDVPLESEIISSVKQAYSLEDQLFAAPDHYTSWDDVYRHYRQGFCEEIARRLADYSWWPEGNYLREGDKVMAVPDSIVVLEVGGTHAVVTYPSPELMKVLWGSKEYTVDRLQREGDHWVIVESRTTDQMPSR
jgi:hypothetical protein